MLAAIVAVTILQLLGRPIAAQPLRAPSALDALVDVGLQRNLGKRQHDLAVRRAAAAVRQARGLYLPSATLNARYSSVSGSVVDLGSVVNPAFDALNQLLQRPAFPTNLDLRLPQTQETTVRLTQPLFEPQIIEANRIAGALADAQVAERATFTRQLAADIRSGYLNYAKASRFVELYETTIPLLEENLRVSERLVAAGKATPDVVLRARAERSDVVQKRDEAVQAADAVRQALNFLLDRDLATPVALIADSLLGFAEPPELDAVTRQAVLAREELRGLDHAMRVSGAQERAALATFLPSVAIAVDYGFQGNDYRFDSQRDHTIASVVLSWNLFNGGQDVARAHQASVERRRLEYRRSELEKLVALQVRTSWESARVARSAIGTAGDRLESARRTFELVRRRHEAGSASQIEFLDARTAYTSASLNQILTTYDYYLRRVALDRASATYPLEVR
ncbi:MAG: TolC family protein [Gemmatimonadaceae bacterium]